MGKSSKSHRGKGKRRNRRKAPNPGASPPAMLAKCDSVIEKKTKKHLQVLREMISFSRLPENHPLHMTWSSPTSLARFQLHHLADDLILLKHVDGLKGLVKRMVTDTEAYEDYRFELRTAANIARSGTSKVLSLAGERTGPDVVFRSTNGKDCGLACYRSRGEALPVEEVDERCFKVMTEFGKAFFHLAIGADVGLEVIFPSFPPSTDDWSEAAELIVRLWQTADPPELEGKKGIRVRRLKISSLAHLGVARRARVRFMFRVGERERFRCIRHIEQKLLKENKWAADYNGIPLFVYQTSPWDTVPSEQDLAALLNRQETAFGGILSSELNYPVEAGIAHSFEHIVACAPGLHLSFRTYGQNSRVWAGAAPTVELVPEYTCSFWDAWEQGNAVMVALSKPLSLVRKRRKLVDHVVKDLRKVDNKVIQAIAENAVQMRDEDDPFEW